VEDWNEETIFCGHYRSIFNQQLANEAVEFDEKRKIRTITPFNVIQGHGEQYQKARMRIPITD